MSRVLVPHESKWYDKLKAIGYYGETDFENSIRQHLESLFPDYHVFPFKKDIKSRSTNEKKKPDLAMVRKNLTAWGIIEVELAEHTIGHVLDQLRVFKDGDYNAPETALYVQNKLKKHCNKTINLARLTSLFAEKTPSILVIADSHNEAWNTEVLKLGADLCVFEIFKSARGRHLYRTFGKFPIVAAREVQCRKHPQLANMMEITGVFQFRKTDWNKPVDIDYDGIITPWNLIEDGGITYLRFCGRMNPLSPNTPYCLFADKANKYYLKSI